jgi:TIR domain
MGAIDGRDRHSRSGGAAITARRDRVFVSYSHADRAWHDRVKTHLDALDDILHVWSDELIRTGSNWQEEILRSLEDSQAAVLIVTPNYLSSSFVREHEIPQLLKRRSEEGLLVFPMIAEPCYWQRFPWLESMQVLLIAADEGPQPSSHEIDQNLTALTKQIEAALLAARADEPEPSEPEQRVAVSDDDTARSDRRRRLARVISRLHSLEAAEGQTYDDEKWHLGPELDRLSDAIDTVGDDPRWRTACEHVRSAILLSGNPSELRDCINELEQLE